MKTAKYLGYIMFGSIAGFLINTLLKYSGVFSLSNGKTIFTNFLVILVAFIFGTIFQVIVHEFGHVIFGLVTKYEFVSLGIGPFLFYKDGNKIRVNKILSHGFLGQNVMMPILDDYSKQPYMLYLLGGVIANFVFSTIFLLVALLGNFSVYFTMIAYTFTLVGVIFIFNNLAPHKVNGLLSDGYSLYFQKNSKKARKSVHIQLKIYALLSKGIKLTQMPKEWFELTNLNDADLSNPIYINNVLNKCSLMVEKHEFEDAQQIYQYLLDNIDASNKIYLNEIKCELLFLYIINNSGNVEEIYSEELKRYIELTKLQMSRKRLMYAFYLIYEHKTDKADKIYNEAAHLQQHYFLKGEADIEMELISHIRNNA